MRRNREYSKATLAKATEILWKSNRELVLTERRRWLPRVLAAGLAGLFVGAGVAWGLTRVLS